MLRGAPTDPGTRSGEGAGDEAAPPVEIIRAPSGTGDGDSLFFDVLHEVPFCFYRFAEPGFVQRVGQICLGAEADILKLPVSKKWSAEQARLGRDQMGTTARYPFYNMFLIRDVAMIRIFRAIQQCYLALSSQLGFERAPVWIQCWQNILRTRETLHIHAHNYFMHGHMTVATPGSRTGYVFEDGAHVEIENEPGLLTLIGKPGVQHYTTPCDGPDPRISIAFDLCREPHMSNEVLHKQTFIPFL